MSGVFHGSIPADLRSIIYEHAESWPDTDLYVGCSGNFTIERTLQSRPGERRAIHGNDVQAYSSALGWWLAGRELDYRLKDEHRDELAWLEPYLATSTDTLATLMLGTRFLQYVGRQGVYYERMVRATVGQFPTMHAKTVAKLNALTLRLADYYCGDVRDYLRDVVPADAPVAMFPPFYAGDYEAQFAGIDEFFDWPAPSYDLLDEDGKEEIIGAVLDRPHWILGLHIARDELRPWLRGVVQTSNRGMPIYVYASSGARRVVAPAQQVAPILLPKIGPDEDLGDRMAIHVLTGGQFSAVRSQFMSKTILPGSPLLACAVSVDRKLIGAFAYLPPKFDPSTAYLMSDFPVSWTRYRRLAKLIVMAAASREAQLLLQRSLSKRLTGWSTTAFTDRPNSAKYGRGIPGVKLQKRSEPAADGIHRYQLQYGGPLGDWTLQEALAEWKRRHGKDER
ncbi:putative antirestriction adenine methyltransferase [Micromonospora chersina]|uniref:putative antirestriction adenine methyltransferase n=1 Tax=Micromonospora chersina TaxID=47854 RepID=UPI00371BA8DD